MRAIMANMAGGPEVLEYVETAGQKLGPGELLVEAASIGVNFIEIYQRSGVYRVEYPFIPGTEAAGTVLEVGDEVQGFQPGDRVLTERATGAYAERFTVAAEHAARLPEHLDLVDAGALPLQGCTAHYLANSVSNPQAGDTVLVHAGAGGVGLILTQLLAARGVRVITTASTDEKRALSVEAGAAHSIGYDGFTEQVRDLTDGRGATVVYDGVGKSTFDGSLDALRTRGQMVLFGGASGQVPPFDLQRLNAGGSLSITRPSLPHFMLEQDEREWRYRELFSAIENGSLRLRIGERFPLARAADAHRALAGRGTTGKVLLVP